MRRVLLVDDDPNLRESAQDILEDAGYQVRAAGDLKAARQLLAGEAAHVVIVDFNLPDGKGAELAQQVRAADARVKIVLMTGEVPAATGAPTTLFDAVLTKPVDPAMLLTLLAAFDINANPPA